MAMLDSTVAALENALCRYEVLGKAPEPIGTRHSSITPFQAFDTSDGPMVVAAGNDNLWQKLCHAIGRPELLEDPRFSANDLRTGSQQALEEELNSTFRSRPTAEWLELLSETGVPCAPIRDMADVVEDEHLKSRGMLHVMDDGRGFTFRTAASPIRIDGRPLQISSHAPELGEHNESVLREWLGDA